MNRLYRYFNKERVTSIARLIKALKRKHLFGKYMGQYHNIVELYTYLNDWCIYIQSCRICTKRAHFTPTSDTANKEFVNDLRFIYNLARVKPSSEQSLKVYEVMDAYLEEYFNEKKEKLTTPKTYFEYQLFASFISMSLGTIAITWILINLTNFVITFVFLLILFFLVGYAQCRLCA